jgi:hypothetical protein
MSGQGYIKLYRSLFTHEFFRPSPFTEREAFSWMISEAAWKTRQRRIGQFFVELQRGDLAASLRHLAEVWMWSVGAVRGYLSRCEKAEMLSTRSDKGITVITVCNYDTYQGDDLADDTVDDKVSAQSQQGLSTVSAHAQHNTEELKKLKESKPSVRKNVASPRGTRIDPNWKPSEPDSAFAKQLGFSDYEIDREAAQFRDYWTGVPASKGVKTDWSATWRNRLRDRAERLGKRPVAQPELKLAPNWDLTMRAYTGGRPGMRTTWAWGGAEPGYPGCVVPPEIQRKHGFEPAGEIAA